METSLDREQGINGAYFHIGPAFFCGGIGEKIELEFKQTAELVKICRGVKNRLHHDTSTVVQSD